MKKLKASLIGAAIKTFAVLEIVSKAWHARIPADWPQVHGEVTNGGTPDWIMRKKYLVNRSNDPVYQQYVDRIIISKLPCKCRAVI